MAREDLKKRIAAIEEAYEFMLSYAARGLDDDVSAPLRVFLDRTQESLQGLGDAVARVIDEAAGDPAAEGVRGFLAVIEQDSAASHAAVGMVLAQKAISSQLIDNLNASIHLRALLTDLFLVDEALKLGVGDESPPASFAPDDDEQFDPSE